MRHSLLPPLLVACCLNAAPTVAKKAVCSIENILACTRTTDLLVEAAVAEKLRRYIGDRPAGWLYEDGTMAGQVIEVLNGPDPDPPVRFGDDLVRFSACRWHSCPEKGAVVLTTDGEIVAVGVIQGDHVTSATLYGQTVCG